MNKCGMFGEKRGLCRGLQLRDRHGPIRAQTSWGWGGVEGGAEVGVASLWDVLYHFQAATTRGKLPLSLQLGGLHR